MTDKYHRFENMDSEISLDIEEQQPRGPFGFDHIYIDPGEKTDDPSLSGSPSGSGVTNDNNNDISGSVSFVKTTNNGVIEDGEAGVDIRDYGVVGEPEEEILTGVRLYRRQLRRVLEHLAFRAVTVMLVVVDLILVITDLALYDDMNQPLEITSLIILTYFLVEGGLRIFAQGPREFVRHWIEVLDAVVIVISFIFAILPLALSHLNDNVAFIRLIVVGRLIRVVLIVRLVTEKKNLEKATRQVVSQNKRRYQRDGFDLDLCYITDRVIAMSFPSTGVMAFYRNPIKEVARFLDTKHKDHYRVFNLCSERMYDESLFHNRVNRYRIDDHNVPKLRDMLHFARTAREWFADHIRNVIAVHCKGGKGRTGTMICTWLVECGAFEEAKDSLEYFGDRRTDLSVGSQFQGVETPSQSRYVGYFEKTKRFHNGQMPPECTLKLTTLIVTSITGVGASDGTDLSCRISTENRMWSYQLNSTDNLRVTFDNDNLTLHLEDTPTLTGDVKVMFFSSTKSAPKGYDDCLFYFWFYTSYIENNSLALCREELDNPHKSKTWNVFRESFGVHLTFEQHDQT